MQYALDAAPRSQGIDLIPTDPLEAVNMRLKIAEHDKIVLPKIFAMSMSRFKDRDALDAFVQ